MGMCLPCLGGSHDDYDEVQPSPVRLISLTSITMTLDILCDEFRPMAIARAGKGVWQV